jgi:preprotein translocase subunit SecA
MKLLLDYAVALTNLNGVIDVEKVVEIYNSQNEPHIEIKDVELLIDEHEEELKRHFVLVEEGLFVHDSFLDFNEVLELMARKMNKPYYIPNKKELLRYTDDEYYEETIYTKRLYRFLKKFVKHDNVNSVEDVLFDVIVRCQMEEKLGDIMNYLNQIEVVFDSEKELREALDLIVDVYNHTRLWSNNGFTPNELSKRRKKPNLEGFPEKNFEAEQSKASNVIPMKRVGRNDPCPCGSGKKYKKCCMDKNR